MLFHGGGAGSEVALSAELFYGGGGTDLALCGFAIVLGGAPRRCSPSPLTEPGSTEFARCVWRRVDPIHSIHSISLGRQASYNETDRPTGGDGDALISAACFGGGACAGVSAEEPDGRALERGHRWRVPGRGFAVAAIQDWQHDVRRGFGF